MASSPGFPLTPWEIGITVSKGELSMPLSIREFTDRLEQVDRVEVLPADVATWIKNFGLDWDHRALVATAVLHACPLVTPDAAIRAYHPQTIWQTRDAQMADCQPRDARCRVDHERQVIHAHLTDQSDNGCREFSDQHDLYPKVECRITPAANPTYVKPKLLL